MDQQDGRHHVADIELGCTGSGAGAGEPITRFCAVCTEPLAWVAVGSCGHGVVCPRCMVKGNRCCSVCGADCPSVVLARTADGMGGGSDPVVPALPLPAPTSKEGNVGEYWYHGDTAAYFHGEQQHEEARDAFKKTKPRYHLWTWFVSILFGTIIGSSFAGATKGGKAMKVLVYALGMCIPLSVASLLWCPDKIDEL